jgi:hypothetical protein
LGIDHPVLIFMQEQQPLIVYIKACQIVLILFQMMDDSTFWFDERTKSFVLQQII